LAKVQIENQFLVKQLLKVLRKEKPMQASFSSILKFFAFAERKLISWQELKVHTAKQRK
jgi:hypothetical protein